MPDSIGTKIAITEEVTNLSVTNNNSVAVTLSEDVTTVTVNNMALPAQFQDAANIAITPYNTITSSNLQTALQQLADQDFRGASAPSGSTVAGTSTVQEGDTWYDTDDDQFKIYREVSSNVYNWVPILVGTGDSDTLDGGSY
jgi:hypothetical protein|tara:strand:- start:455 stop:880 length:426 start_codon:yes stop_codon:yes gene_type:complete